MFLCVWSSLEFTLLGMMLWSFLSFRNWQVFDLWSMFWNAFSTHLFMGWICMKHFSWQFNFCDMNILCEWQWQVQKWTKNVTLSKFCYKKILTLKLNGPMFWKSPHCQLKTMEKIQLYPNSLTVALQWSPLDVWLVKMWLLTLCKCFLVQANEQDSKNHVKIVFTIKSTSMKLEQPIECGTSLILL
jgi:hypothetical protein